MPSEHVFTPSVIYRTANGQDAIQTPAHWSGLPINLYRSQIKGERGPCHATDPIIICCHNIQGRRWHRQNGKLHRFTAKPGQLEILGNDYQREWARWDTTPGFNIGINFTAQSIQRLTPELAGLQLNTVHEFVDSRLNWLIHELWIEAQRCSQGLSDGKLYAESLSCTILAVVSTHYATTPTARCNQTGTLSPKARNNLLEFIDEHFCGDVSIQTLASLANLSSSHFSRSFQNTYGVSPHRFIQQKRIDKAMRLLRHTTHSITEIAYQLGFSSHSHFSKTFRLHTGVTPSEIREAQSSTHKITNNTNQM